jgi:CRISPR-associated protein Cas2
MQYVISYDISDNGRRSRLAASLLDFGARVEESVFVADLDEALAARMLERIQHHLDPTFDKVHVFRLCKDCAGHTVVFAAGREVAEPDYYII